MCHSVSRLGRVFVYIEKMSLESNKQTTCCSIDVSVCLFFSNAHSLAQDVSHRDIKIYPFLYLPLYPAQAQGLTSTESCGGSNVGSYTGLNAISGVDGTINGFW